MVVALRAWPDDGGRRCARRSSSPRQRRPISWRARCRDDPDLAAAALSAALLRLVRGRRVREGALRGLKAAGLPARRWSMIRSGGLWRRLDQDVNRMTDEGDGMSRILAQGWQSR